MIMKNISSMRGFLKIAPFLSRIERDGFADVCMLYSSALFTEPRSRKTNLSCEARSLISML